MKIWKVTFLITVITVIVWVTYLEATSSPCVWQPFPMWVNLVPYLILAMCVLTYWQLISEMSEPNKGGGKEK